MLTIKIKPVPSGKFKVTIHVGNSICKMQLEYNSESDALIAAAAEVEAIRVKENTEFKELVGDLCLHPYLVQRGGN